MPLFRRTSGPSRGRPPPPTGDGDAADLAGRVQRKLYAIAQKAVPGATVYLQLKDGNGTRQVTSDENGRFDFEGMPDAVYSLDVYSGSHVDRSVETGADGGPLRPGGPEIEVRVEPVDARLRRWTPPPAS